MLEGVTNYYYLKFGVVARSLRLTTCGHLTFLCAVLSLLAGNLYGRVVYGYPAQNLEVPHQTMTPLPLQQ